MWQGACMAGGHVWQQWGMHGRGACHAGGHACQGACMAGGMPGRGHAWHGCASQRGGFMAEGGVRGMLSISGRYVSYWNAFLFKLVYLIKFIPLYQDLS